VAHGRKCEASSLGLSMVGRLTHMFSICRRGYSLIRRYSGVLAVIVNQAGVKGAEFLFPQYANSRWYVKLWQEKVMQI
jgi:hypothetical protein